MNIKINKTPVNRLFEAETISDTKDRLVSFLEKFPEDAKSWKQATDELPTIAKYLIEENESDIVLESYKTPSARNKGLRKIILTEFKKLDKQQKIRFENQFKHWFTQFSNLFESENMQDKKIEKILDSKSKQFTFDCGLFMGSLISDLDGLIFSMRTHDEKTSNFEEFVASINSFLSTSKESLTATDISRLEAHYLKHSINADK